MFCLDPRGIFIQKFRKFPRVGEQVILMERRLPLALFTLFPLSLYCFSLSTFLFVLSSENLCQLRLKVETPTFYSRFYWVAFKTQVFIWPHGTAMHSGAYISSIRAGMPGPHWYKWSEGIWTAFYREYLFVHIKLVTFPTFPAWKLYSHTRHTLIFV